MSMMANEVFKKFYAQLNLQQKEAVDTLEGPVMVVAGPGTGKTQVLTLRIANILLQEKAKPEEILALTFTENAAFNMKRRLFQILGPVAYRARIATFHSFCNDIIVENPESFSFVKSAVAVYEGARSITQVEQTKIIEEILTIGKFERLNMYNPFANYILELSSAVSNFKREGILPGDYQKVIDAEEERIFSASDLYHEKGAYKGKMKAMYRDKFEQIAKNREILDVYKKYQEALENSGRYDYDDMILLVVRALRPCGTSDVPHLLEKLREQYRYILVDEHQDANSAQNEVVGLLAGENRTNIFVVGDEKQSIFRFQGASMENILYFKNKFPGSKVISLEENYRSPQAIIDCAQSVITNNAVRVGKYLENISDTLVSHSAAVLSHGVDILEAENHEGELCFIVNKIKELHASGVAFEEIAILYRNNWEGHEIAAALERAGIPYSIESNRNIFEDKTIHDFIKFLKFASRNDLSRLAFRRDEIDAELADLLFSDFAGIPAIDIYKLLDFAANEPRKKSLFWIMDDKFSMEQSGIGSFQKIFDFAQIISKCVTGARQKNALSAFEITAKESGFLRYIVSLNSQDAILKFRVLFTELKSAAQGRRDYTLGDFAEHLELLRKYKIALSQKAMRIPANAVRLMTAHKSKGLEFEYVVIAGCADASWGGRKRPDPLKLLEIAKALGGKLYTNEIEDARRLFYVAFTRAKKGVFATCALQSFEGREQLPSRFISEIKPELVSRVDSALYTADVIAQILHVSAEERPRHAADRLIIEDREYLRAVFLRRGFAATHLNNYLDCPWKYFFRNLVRLPEAQALYLFYGSAVHFALKRFFDKKEACDKEYLREEFLRALARQPLREYEFVKYRERGEKALAAYFDNYDLGVFKSTMNTINEFNVGSVMLDGEVRLTGKIDKIELLGKEINVVDYKTGRRKTRGELEGLTKNSKGNEKRQLVFYKLLLDRCGVSEIPHANVGFPIPHIDRFVMTSGEIDFVEPEKKTGKFYKEKFIISNDDVRELEYKIQDVTAEILGFSFWNERCEKRDCEYCKLREAMSALA